MGIVILRQDGKIGEWKKALQAKNLNVKIYGYQEDHPKDEIRMALVWKHPKNTLSQYPDLKCIASFGAGVDFIFNDPDIPRHIPITRVVDRYLANDMSEFVIAGLFAYIKNLNSFKSDQPQHQWKPRNYKRINEVTVGIMGLGELGSALAKDLVKFGFKTLGWSSSNKIMNGVDTFCAQRELPRFLSKTNVLVCLLPLTPKTEGILNKSLFEKLPKGAAIINVARGGHLVDTDLIAMLDNGHLSAALLDVFHTEPLQGSHPFWEHPKVHITPHIASVSDPRSVVDQILVNYDRLMNGQPLMNEVSREKGY